MHQSYAEEEEPEGRYYTAVMPYHVQAGAAIKNGLGEADKMVDGENCIIRCNVSGILSSGVVLPRRLRMMKTGSTKIPNCGIELTCVAIIMLREVIEERYIATPAANSANEPAIDTPSTPFAANLRSARLRADRLFRSRSSAWVKSSRAAVADEGH